MEKYKENPDISSHAEGGSEALALVDGPKEKIESWVQKIAGEAQADIDWHYVGGRGVITFRGDEESRERVKETIEKHPFDGPFRFESK